MTARQGVERPAVRALVVDDNHLMVDLVSAFLKKSRGYEVETADDGTPLPDCRGWTCGGCDALYATASEAEACCVRPVLRLYTGDEPR